jgi:N-acetylglucosaminyl-diphospho-decaprenol L-rhamnosyltransferase
MQIDAVVVAYRSSAHLRRCVEPLCGQPDLRVIVVDNACPERSTSTIADLPVEIIEMGRNAGFSAGCNAGARVGVGEAILFLNPDARITPPNVRLLASRLVTNPTLGAVGPRVLSPSGEIELSMRRAPSLRSALGEALFFHHIVRGASSPTEFVRGGYELPSEAEWLTGAVLLVRRSAFDTIGGFDERFFLYSEDTDLCIRLRKRGLVVFYDPAATAEHEGGGSAPRPAQAALKAEARVLYARLHERGVRYAAFRAAFAIHELVRVPVAATRSMMHLRARLAAVVAALRSSPSLENGAPVADPRVGARRV